MIILTHQIAGITFRTETNVEVISLQNDSFHHFLVNGNGLRPDVYHRICGIDRETLTLPPFSQKEKKRISRCICFPKDDLNVPPLQSPLVRDRLTSCLSRTEQVGLESNIFSVIIRDHIDRKIDYFYISDCGEVFKDPGLEHIFRRMFASFLPAFSAVMIHSSGLIRHGRAALFLAPDEGGKTTVMEHSTDGTILCDDQIILRKEDDTVMAHATPWGHITGGPQRAKVGGLFLLEKAAQFELIPLKAVDAVEYFWKEHLKYRAFLPKNLRLNAFEVIMAACHQAPVYRMRFPEDYVDWDAIDAAMVK
jgi:hypothetical protein